MTSKRVNLSASQSTNSSTKQTLTQNANILILFCESDFGDKCLSVFARVLGFGAVLGSLAFTAWGILHTSF